MVKSYLKYTQESAFGVITTGIVEYDKSGENIISSALENVSVWNVRKGTEVSLSNKKKSVEGLHRSQHPLVFFASNFFRTTNVDRIINTKLKQKKTRQPFLLKRKRSKKK